jgi:hypothetical protein
MKRALIVAFLGLGISTAFAGGATWDPGDTQCVPNFRADKPVGYLCVKVDPKSEYIAMGLRKGDNVVEIDDQPIFDPSFKGDSTERALNLWRQLDKEDTGTMRVERGNSILLLRKKR